MQASCILTSEEGVLLTCSLNEIQTMFPQLAKQPGDLFTDHPLNNQRSVVLRKKTKKGKLKVNFSLLQFGYSQVY